MSEINMKYECDYIVETIDPTNLLGGSKKTKLKAKKIVVTETDTIFYDYYGCVSGCFRNQFLIGYTHDRDW